MTGAQRYARVLRAPDVARLMAAAVLARLPIGIETLGIVLFVRGETGSFALAGLVVAAFGIGNGVSYPLMGRLIDVRGHASVLLPLAVLHAVALGALVAVGLAGAPGVALLACGLLVGASEPPVGSVVRPMLPRLLAHDATLLPTAYALDGIGIEMVFVAGPLIVAVTVSVGAPAMALVLAAGLVLAGTALLVTTPASRSFRPSGSGERHLLGALASRGVRTVVLATVPIGFAVGATEITMTAFASDHGSRAAAGALMALWAIGSGVGGVIYGAREHRLAPAPRWVRLAILFPLGSAPLILATSIPVMAVVAPLAGAFLAPVLAAQNQLLGDVAPPDSMTEAFAWPITAIAFGVAAGAGAAGVLVEGPGWRAGFAAAVVAGLAAGAIAVARRRTVGALAPA